MAKAHGLIHTRDVKAFVSKVMVFDKSVGGGGQKRTTRGRLKNMLSKKNNRRPPRKLRRKVW